MRMKNSTLRLIFLSLATLFISWDLSAQVSGKVTSAADGAALIGATIKVKNSTVGTISEIDGSYQIDAKTGDVLVISYIGMLSQEVTVENSTIDIVLTEDATSLSDVIVTATRQPIRKLEATTAVNVVNAVKLEETKPEGIAEAINGTPGMYSSFSQGRFRGAIFTRGFPDGSGNGLVYTGILSDGLPTLATTARPPDFALGMDPGVDRVEVVRGSAATLFGRSSAAGVVNIINRTGGTEHHGMLRLTNYSRNVDRRDGFDYKIDGAIHGPISENVRYNVGGYYVNDRGFRDLGYNDRGGQLRANVDFLLNNNSNLRVFGSYVNVSIQNMIDIPYVLNTFKPREGWENTDSYYFPGLDTLNFTITNKEGETEERSVKALNEDGNYARGGNIGAMLDYNFNDQFSLSYKGRYQSYNHGTKFNLGVSTFYTDAPFSHIRILIDGDGTDTDIMNELRFTYSIKGANSTHRISAGTFLSQGNYTPETYSLAGWHTNDRDNLEFHGFFPPPAFPPPTRGSAARVDEYQVNTTAFFIGDEFKFGDKLSGNIGFRWDKVKMDLQGFYDNDGDGTIDVNKRDEEHSDYSMSLGFNYLLGPRSAVYGNAVRAFRMPDYSAYTALNQAALTGKPTIEDNEIVNNFELGYRTGIGELGIDVAAFYTKIDNRLATIYEGAIATLKPLGTNQIAGAELALTYAPSAVKGLLLTTSLTLQNATFLDFKIPVTSSDPNGDSFGNTYVFEGTEVIDDTTSIDRYSIDLRGNQLPRVPKAIWNFNLSYNSKNFGASIASNLNLQRFPDATNVFEQDPYWLVNAGIYGQYPFGKSKIKLSITVKNLINNDTALRMLYVSDNDAALARKQILAADPASGDTTFFTGIPALPRRILISLAYEF